jgi:hypothetical protein
MAMSPMERDEMNLGSVWSDAVFRLERFDHQRQIKSFEQLNSKDGGSDGFSNSLFKVTQRALVKMAGAALEKPALTLVCTLLASRFMGISAAPLSETFKLKQVSEATKEMAQAFEHCWSQHRHDNFPNAFTKVRCLGQLADDICSDRELGTSSRYNFDVKHDESNDRKHNVCRQLLGRSAGLRATISSARKTPDVIIQDVVRDVMDTQRENDMRRLDAMDIIDNYGLRGEVDASLMDSRDVSNWVSQHRSELERGHLVWPPDYAEFIHAADNRYKETGDIKDQETYLRVMDGINKMDLTPYIDRYYGAVAQHITDELKV